MKVKEKLFETHQQKLAEIEAGTSNLTRDDLAREFYLQYEVEGLKDQLVQRANELRQRMERLVQAVEEGRTVNSLGEVQGAGGSVDVLCGKLDIVQRLADEATKANARKEAQGA